MENYVQNKIHNQFTSMLNNPEFRKFVKENEKKSIQQIVFDYGLNIEFARKNNVYQSQS